MSGQRYDTWLEIMHEMPDETHEFWMDLGRRLVHGEKTYGGGVTHLATSDLDQMALEEIEDYLIYRAAKRYMENRNGK